MTGEVVRGPWPSRPVRQSMTAGKWWHRDDDGALYVLCDHGMVRKAPIPMADLTQPLPDRPPNRDRITCALDLRMMYGPEVDEALGVNDAFDTVVDAWEAGTVIPSHEDIRRLSTLTGMLPHWFYMGTLPQFEGFICGTGAHAGDGEPCPTCGVSTPPDE